MWDRISKLEGSKVIVPGLSRSDLPVIFKEMGLKVGVEIGVYKGEYTEKFCKAGLKMYAVDPWLNYGDYIHPKGQEREDFLYGHTWRTLAPYKELAVIIRKTSMEAAAEFQDNSVDFVYIDGHHGFRYIAEDIWEWTKKVRVGGVISGHDYGINSKPMRDPFVLHVKHVVDAWIKTFKISKMYLTDIPDNPSKEDRTRSWFWIKE